MQELLLKFQEAAFQMDPPSLWIPGCIGIVLGLFLWLGGTRYSSFVIGILGAGFGASCGILISHWFDTHRMMTVVRVPISIPKTSLLIIVPVVLTN